jgi:ElaB/YqjD/DUF883 family membrane-anchored ribosome-binding protein
MENSQSVLIPLTQAARNLAGSVQRMFAPQLDALRERSDGVARSDLVDAAAQFLDTATETMRAARDVAQDAAQPYRKPAQRILETAQDQLLSLGTAAQHAAKPYRKPARQILATAQEQLHTLGKSIDTRSRHADNLITRHPYAATMVAAGVGYLLYRRWHNHNSHAHIGADEVRAREQSTDPAHEND